jgi:hypothetical protein
MAITEVTMYRIVCDGDNCDASAQEGDFYAWSDPGQALGEAEGADWLTLDDKHYCDGCVSSSADLRFEMIQQRDGLPEEGTGISHCRACHGVDGDPLGPRCGHTAGCPEC